MIIGVCRLIRKESVGMFYSRCHFILRGPVGAPRESSVPDVGNAWGKVVQSDQIRNLRKVTLQVLLKWRSMRATACMTFTLSPTSELRVECGTELTRESQKRLAAHVKKVESTRKLLSLRGEAIILALTMEGKLWSFGELNHA